MRFTHLVPVFLLASSTVGCLDTEPTSEDLAGEDAPAIAPRKHQFFIDAKNFIREIPSSEIGSLGNPIVDAQLSLLAAATNAAYSELPTTGNRFASTYRVFAHVRLDVTCTGSAVNMVLSEPASDVGFEGPFQGALEPLQLQASASGKFVFRAAGRPNLIAEPVFQAIQLRSNRHIWYQVRGHVACTPQGFAQLFIDEVQNTAFPSLRVWAQHAEGLFTDPEAMLVDRVQGKFSSLWSLAPLPPPPTL